MGRPFKSGELVRDRETYVIGRTAGTVVSGRINVAWRGGVHAYADVDALEHIQEFGHGAIIRNGMGRFEVPGIPPTGGKLTQFDSWAEAMEARRAHAAAAL